jgi:phospholipase/carboxylesterase
MLAGLLVLCACHSNEKQPDEPPASPLPKATANTAQADVGFINNPKSGLRTLEVGSGSRSLILLHGYGSSPEDWMQFTETIRVSNNTRFVFPEAPELTVPPDGPAGGRSWWRIDLARYMNRGQTLPDFSGSRPEGIESSKQKIRALIEDVETRLGSNQGPPMLGGFSQGAMIAADVAFTTDQPLKALIILSGTFVDETGWTKGMAQRKGLPVFISHGRKDDILQYGIAIRLRDAMKKAGLQVRWVPFAGGHEVPAEVVTALNTFLAHLD